jgi:hypothetical protein
MVLISGSTRIYFNDKYHMGPKNIGGQERQWIAFNEENDLAQKPDPNNVHSLKAFFPGTVLTLRFYIDEKYLEKFCDTNVNATEKLYQRIPSS